MFEIGRVLEFPELWWPVTMGQNVVSITSVFCCLPKLFPLTQLLTVSVLIHDEVCR